MANIIKQCQRCGWSGPVRPRERRCKQRRFGQGSYACWGQLLTVRRPEPAKAASQNARPERQPKRPQEKSATKRDAARRRVSALEAQVETATATIANAYRSIKRWRQLITEWERRADYHGRRASMTDDELRTEFEDRKKRQADKSTTRAIVAGKTTI